MRYLVKAKVKPNKEKDLLRAIESGALGRGSIAGDEYIYDMQQARKLADDRVCWIEVCYCATPLAEELPYWEEYFDILEIKNAHGRERCKDLNGEESWACSDCDCTKRLAARLETWGGLFLDHLKK